MKYIKRIERNHHLQHLVNIAPFVTVIFVLQCYLISHLEMARGHQDYYLFLGGSLAMIMSFFVIHDSYYHVDLYQDHLHLHFKLFGINKKISFHDIDEIIVPEEAETFSTVQLKLQSGKQQNIYLIDDAIELKGFIEDFKAKKQQEVHDFKDMAA